MPQRHSNAHSTRGFTLTEVAIVLVIVALLAGGLLMSLSAQYDLRNASETQRTLEQAHEALLGFAAANGRLPCPATAASHGLEAYSGAVGSSPCTSNFAGFLPAATLGLSPTNGDGFAIDSWGNPIRYAVSRDPEGSTMASNAVPALQRDRFTASDGMRTTGIANLHPDLHVCAGGTGAAASTATFQCSSNQLTRSAVAIVYSLGKNGGGAPSGPDEQGNVDGDRVFVSHVPSPSSAAGGEFDDLVTWISPNILYNRLIAAGRLP